MSVIVLYSTDGFFVLILRIFNFFFVFEHNCLLYEIFWFPSRIITLLKRPIEGKNSREKTQSWKKRIWIC